MREGGAKVRLVAKGKPVYLIDLSEVMFSLDLLQVSLLINKQMGRRKRKGKGEESETCGLRVPKTRPVEILTGGFLSC